MKIEKTLLKLTLVAILALSIPLNIKAADSGGMQISPLTYKYDIRNGESVSGILKVKNLNATDLNYIIETEDFSQVSDEGAPSFKSIGKNEGITTLADWFTFGTVKEGVIGPNKSADIGFKINIPDGVEPGGHYAAIFVKEIKKNAEGETQLGVSSRVGALVLVSVPGDVTKTVAIKEVTAPKFVWKGPVDLEMKIENTGSTHYDSTGNFEISPILGNKTEATFKYNEVTKSPENIHTILPGNVRTYKATWGNKYPFGYYKITASATDGDGNPVTKDVVLWAVPLIIVIPSLIVLALIIWLIFFLKKHLKFVPDVDKKE